MSIAEPLRVRRADLVKVLLLGVGQAATLGGLLVLFRDVIDLLAVAPTDLRRLYRLMGVMAALMALNAWLRGVQFTTAEQMGYELVRRLRMTMYAHLRGMAPRQLQSYSHGAILLRFTGDLSMMRTWVSRGIGLGTIALVTVLGTLAVVALLSPPLALTLLAVLSLGAAVSLPAGTALRETTRLVRIKRSGMMSNVIEQIHALPVVQVFGRSAGEQARLSRQNDSLTGSLRRLSSIRGRLRGISSAAGWLAVIAVLAVGAAEVSRGRATVGLVVAGMTAARQLRAPVRALGLAHDYWQRHRVSRAKILDFLAVPSGPASAVDGTRLRVGRGRLEFQGVSVAGALSDVTVTATGGEIVAIVGPVGAGKSTLLNLVARFVEPDEGRVVIDGQPLAECTPRSTYRHLGVVSPDLPLMRGTVKRNLTYRDPDATEDEIHRVVTAAGLDHFLGATPAGMSAWLTEGGKNLSSGQRQRLKLARALIGNPRILLLDEPTANLDAEGKALFHQILSRHHGTVLLVTHDPDEASLADHVWRMDGGRVVEVLPGDSYRDHLWLSRQKGVAWQTQPTT